MKILLDTHIVIWALFDSSFLSPIARELIWDSQNEIYYSILSMWEIEMKHSLHPDKMKVSAREVQDYCIVSGFSMLGLKESHIDMLSTLKRPDEAPPHKDPFDKMLICQSLAERMTFLTHDGLIRYYDLNNIVVV